MGRAAADLLESHAGAVVVWPRSVAGADMGALRRRERRITMVRLEYRCGVISFAFAGMLWMSCARGTTAESVGEGGSGSTSAATGGPGGAGTMSTASSTSTG